MTASTAKARFDAAGISAGLRALVEPDAVAELRVLGIPRVRVAGGYFNNREGMTVAARDWSGRGKGVYLTLNPVDPALLARAANRVIEAPEHTTSDRDILRRNWLYLDFDAVRASGVSATHQEHLVALERASQVRAVLAEAGWPDPIEGDSGNGASLYYRIALANDADALALIDGCLQAVAFRFGDERVSVDTSVKNAARIVRVFGTLNAKGDDLIERPHRLARLLHVPEQLTPVPRVLLQHLAASMPDEPQDRQRTGTRGSAFDVDAWIKAHGLQVQRRDTWQGGLRWVLESCPWNADHSDRAAYIVQFPSGAIAAGCHHAGCQGKGWRDLRARYDLSDFRTKTTNSTKKDEGTGGSNSFSSLNSSRRGRSHPWPVLYPEALYGLAGDLVRAIEPVTEADPAALLVRTLLSFGSLVGRDLHTVVEADRHGLNEYAVFVGETGKARKDTARGRVEEPFGCVDTGWTLDCQASGLSTGEGLIFHVRDPIEKQEPVKERGKTTGEFQTVVVDVGVEDKRLFVNESEFARVLKVAMREGNTLSAILRDAWDGRLLRVMTRNSPLTATEAHVSICANITRDELRRYLSESEIAGGTGNRFLFVCTRRSKLLPEGGGPADLGDVLMRLEKATAWAREKPRWLSRDEAARQLWARVYPKLSAGAQGLYGAVTNRAEAHVLRLSCLYAALDMSEVVRVSHLRAALALWRYCAESARWIFGDAVGDPVADRILDGLANEPDGLTRTDIHNLFGRNLPVGRIDAALGLLLASGRALCQRRPGERDHTVETWHLAPLGEEEGDEFDEPCDGASSASSSNPSGDDSGGCTSLPRDVPDASDLGVAVVAADREVFDL